MKYFINIFLGYIAVILMILSVIIWPMRLLTKKGEKRTSLHKSLRKKHILIGHLLIVVSLLHGLLSSMDILSKNKGSILLLLFVLIGVTFSLKKTILKGKKWIYTHRILTIVAIVFLILHLIEIDAYGSMKLRIENLFKSEKTTELIIDMAPEVIVSQEIVEIPTEESTLIIEQNIQPLNNDIDLIPPVLKESLVAVVESTENEVETIVDVVEEVNEEVLGNVYKDGKYIASADGFGTDLTVEVTVEDNIILNIEIIDHNERNYSYYGKAFNSVPKKILETQSTEVDSIAGATYSSKGIINATRLALSQALVSGEIPSLIDFTTRFR